MAIAVGNIVILSENKIKKPTGQTVGVIRKAVLPEAVS